MTVPASLLVSSGLCVRASVCVSADLAFPATFAVSLVFLVRVLRPELVDGVFTHVDACVQREVRLASAAIGAEARSLRDEARADPVIVPIYARAVERARRAHAFVADGVDGLKRTARAKWSGLKDASVAAFFWLRLTASLINLAATVLFTIASEEAKRRAPSVLGWRGVKGIRSPPSEEGQDAAASPSSRSKPDTTLLVVWISAILMYCTQVFVLDAICTGITTFTACFACLAALCGFALMEAERVYLWGSYVIATRDSSDTANPGRRGGNATGGGITAIDLRYAWESLWFLIIITHFNDACLLRIVLGKRPLALASMATCNLAALKAARQAHLTPDVANGSADGAHGDVSKWHGAAMMMLAIGVAKVVATYLVLDFYLGALCFASLCITMSCLPDVPCASGDDDSQEGAGLATDDAGDAEGPDDVVHAEYSSTVAGCDHEEEGSATEDHSDGSDSEEHVEEQRHEESAYSSSSSMDDWSFVEVDQAMPIKDNDGGASRKFKFLP